MMRALALLAALAMDDEAYEEFIAHAGGDV